MAKIIGGKYYKRLSSMILLLLFYAVIIIGTTYAYMSIDATNSVATGDGGCFEVSYSGQNLNAGNVLSTVNYMEGAHTTVTLSKDTSCKIYSEANIYLHTDNSTTAPISSIHALRYKIFMESTLLSEGVITNLGDVLLATVPLTDNQVQYTVYLWIDSNLSSGSYDGTNYFGYIYAESNQTSTVNTRYFVSFDRGNLLYGFKSTNGIVSIPVDESRPDISYANISINSNNDVTVINNGTRADAYGFVGAKVDLIAGKEYIFNCSTNGTWGATDNTGTAEAYLMLNGGYTTWLRLNSNNNYEFTPSTSGTYFLRFDANGVDTTVTYSNIIIIEKEKYTKTVVLGQEYGWLPTFEKGDNHLLSWNYNDSRVKSDTNVSENSNHTLTAVWGNPYQIVNLITNGSFEHGRTDWNNWFPNIDDIAVSSEVSKFGRYSIKNYGTTKWQTINNPFNGVSNHHYYYSSYAYSKTDNCYSTFGYYYDNSFHWPIASHQNVLNVWERKSGIEIGPNTNYQVYYNVADSVSSDGVARECYADGVVVIDLTEVFGSGNEPSKEWCDENIDYFDGSTVVYY